MNNDRRKTGGRRGNDRRRRDRWARRGERTALVAAIVLWVFSTSSLQGQQDQINNALEQQAAQRVDSARQRCDLTRTLVHLVEETRAPSGFGAPLRRNLADCEQTERRYREEAANAGR